MPHVFLSYSRSDRHLAARVRDDLSDQGLEVWSDRRLGLGGSWLAEISAAIDEARAVVLLATPDALASKWVMREVEAALALGKPVVPLLAEGSRFGDLPASLAGINGVDLADGYEDSVKLIAEAFACTAEVNSSVQGPSRTLPMLLLLTIDDSMAAVVSQVARPVGLVVVRPDPLGTDVFAVAAKAHIALIDGRMPVDCGFIAGYVAGRGGRVVCVAKPSWWHVETGPAVRFCDADAADLEREISVAAFLPVRRPG